MNKIFKKFRFLVKENFLKIIPFLLIFFIGFLLLKSNFFAVAQINCKTQFGMCADNELAQFDEFKGKNLFFLNSRVVENIGTKNITNRRVFVQKVFPNTLVVVLEKKKPVVAVKMDIQPKGAFLVDQEGNVTTFVTDNNLPLIIAKEKSINLIIGRPLGEKFAHAAQIMSLVNKSQKVDLGYFDQESFNIELNGSRVYFPNMGDPQVLVGALQLILTRSRIDNKLPKIIDLGYSNPVLRY